MWETPSLDHAKSVTQHPGAVQAPACPWRKRVGCVHGGEGVNLFPVGIVSKGDSEDQEWLDKMEKKKCEKCGSLFGCGANDSGGACWCMEVKVSESVLGELREKFGDCLCPECLRELAGSDVGNQNPS